MSKELIELLREASNYIDALGGDSRRYRQALAQPAAPAVPLADERIESIIRDTYSPDISPEDWCRASVRAAMLAAAPEGK